MTKKTIHKRRNYFINKQVQGIYALFLIMSVGIISLLVSMEILRSFYHSFGGGNGESFFANINTFFMIKVVVLLLLGSLLIGALSLFASHRIAGPIFRLNKSLKNITKGNYDERLSFRKNDYFQEIAKNFNDMADSFEHKLTTENNAIDKMSSKLDDILEQMNLTDFDREATLLSLEELKNLIEKCQQAIKDDRGY